MGAEQLASRLAAARKALAAAAVREARCCDRDASAAKLAVETLALWADPDMAAAKAEWEEAEQKEAWARRAEREAHGSSHGPQRQCSACKTFLGMGAFQCPSCGYLEGVGYQPVPPKESPMERWR